VASGKTLKVRLGAARPVTAGELYWADDSQVSQNVKVAFGLALKGRRPVLVVQAVPNSPGNTELVSVCPLTTGQLRTIFDVAKPPHEGGLAEASFIQVPLVFPIPKAALVQSIGKVSPETLNLVQTRLAQMFGLI